VLRVLAHVIVLSQVTTRPFYIIFLYSNQNQISSSCKVCYTNNIYDLAGLNEYSIWAPRLRKHNGCIRQQNSRDVMSIVRTPDARRQRGRRSASNCCVVEPISCYRTTHLLPHLTMPYANKRTSLHTSLHRTAPD
jgi:hypothetical protein